ncbi:hypothetical protein BB561_001530 [Smittium simulii]|uniref:polynucleotide adenylyltransferase n=1 Tax=Smittium simulii TaxID=133385 RepID=A0A2T9YU83_9FUNG|nr:hypothetical protein BB561_001530 [Smittium simulii]
MNLDKADFISFDNSFSSDSELSAAEIKDLQNSPLSSNKRKFSQFKETDLEYVSSDSELKNTSLHQANNIQNNQTKKQADSYLLGYDGQKLPPWLNSSNTKFSPNKSVTEILNDEVKSFVNYINPTTEEHAIRGWVLEKLKRALSTIFKKSEQKRIEVICFGSYMTGLYLPSSDLDVSVCVISTTTNQLCKEYEEKFSKKKLLFSISLALRKAKFSNFCEVIASARVPIVKTVELSSKISIDISVNALGGLNAASMVNDYLNHQFPVVLRGLSMIIKVFLHQRHMNEVYSGGLGSFAVVMMLISFLQLHPKIQSGAINPEKNMGILLCEFFELYGKRFNYDSVGIVIRNGGKYIKKPVSYERDKGYSRPTQRLYLEDPGDTTNDITKGTYGMNRIRQMFSGAFDLLTGSMFKYHQVCKYGKSLSELNDQPNTKNEYHIRFSSKKKDSGGRNTNKVVKSDNSQYNVGLPASFLSCVISISNQIIKKRRDIASLFYSNVFQNELGVTFNPEFVNTTADNGLLHQNFNHEIRGNSDFKNVTNTSLKEMNINFVVPRSPEYIEDFDSTEEFSSVFDSKPSYDLANKNRERVADQTNLAKKKQTSATTTKHRR